MVLSSRRSLENFSMWSDHSLSSIVRGADYCEVFDSFDQGVFIADSKGRVVYYNVTQAAIDDCAPEVALGALVTELYDITEDQSVIFRCLSNGTPVVNQHHPYRVRRGKEVDAITSVFPLRTDGELCGAISFTKNCDVLERTAMSGAALSDTDPSILANGTKYTFSHIIGAHPGLLRCVEIGRLSADSPSPIMIYGETGTGKEMFAQGIHNYSSRRDRKFVALNCAAIPDSLLESILFGTSKGAFTSASDKPGLFELAHEGTLLLDELHLMPAGLQAKLLRVLQEKKVRRLGSSQERDVNVKVITCLNVPPREAIDSGQLRRDLFYRLGVVFISLPTLRERRGDLDVLVRHLVYKYNGLLNLRVAELSPEVMAAFQGYAWPGNVRELAHVIEASMNIVQDAPVIELDHLPMHFPASPSNALRVVSDDVADDAFEVSVGVSSGPSLGPAANSARAKGLRETQKENERRLVVDSLKAAGGNVTRAAKALGISRQLLHYKMKKFGIGNNGAERCGT
jgi:arginine utilization regulatory protein